MKNGCYVEIIDVLAPLCQRVLLTHTSPVNSSGGCRTFRATPAGMCVSPVCVKAKADSTTKYLVEQFKAEIAALQTNNQKLEEQQKQIF